MRAELPRSQSLAREYFLLTTRSVLLRSNRVADDLAVAEGG